MSTHLRVVRFSAVRGLQEGPDDVVDALESAVGEPQRLFAAMKPTQLSAAHHENQQEKANLLTRTPIDQPAALLEEPHAWERLGFVGEYWSAQA
jgi:hypothetical protein